MKKLLNTLYITTPNTYLSLRNNTIVASVDGQEKVAVPSLNIDSIVIFGQNSVSTPLLGFCAENGIDITFLTRNGRFCCRVSGPVNGNVLLRKKQYELLGDNDFSKRLVKNILFGKLRNSKDVLMRYARTTEDQVKKGSLTESSNRIVELAKSLDTADSIDSMRGIEGAAATIYFSEFDTMLSSSDFRFDVRTRRPPKNEVNACLSFAYTLLRREVVSALETVGLDPAAGFLHTLRPGRPSLALDMMEELRAPLADRFVLSLFHRGQLKKRDFDISSDCVYLNDNGRRTVITSWQNRKQETIQHPFLNEKIQIGVIPYAQSMLLARVFRGDLDEYPPFVWR